MEERIGPHESWVMVISTSSLSQLSPGMKRRSPYASVWIFGFYGNNNLVADNILGDSYLVRCAALTILWGTELPLEGMAYSKGD